MDCDIWKETDEGIHILYFADTKKEIPIRFFWDKTPKMNENNEVVYTNKYDSFYISVIECMNEEVLNCPLSACSAKPQLRYNVIIDKWFCNCPSGALCTKDNDQSELNELLALEKKYDEEHGFCNNPQYWKSIRPHRRKQTQRSALPMRCARRCQRSDTSRNHGKKRTALWSWYLDSMRQVSWYPTAHRSRPRCGQCRPAAH